MRSGSPVEIVLLVPGLLGPAAAGTGDTDAAQALVAGLDLDGLDRLLVRAGHTAEKAADESFEALAFRSFGHAAPPAGADLPVAALTALVDGCADGGSGFRLRADPVHLRADIADLVLFDAADIDVAPDESGALARTVNDAHLAVFGDLYPAVRRADIDAWRDGVARLSRSWAQPLLDALDRGAVARVTIDDERGHRFSATRRGRFRWWRRVGLAATIAGAPVRIPEAHSSCQSSRAWREPRERGRPARSGPQAHSR